MAQKVQAVAANEGPGSVSHSVDITPPPMESIGQIGIFYC